MNEKCQTFVNQTTEFLKLEADAEKAEVDELLQNSTHAQLESRGMAILRLTIASTETG